MHHEPKFGSQIMLLAWSLLRGPVCIHSLTLNSHSISIQLSDLSFLYKHVFQGELSNNKKLKQSDTSFKFLTLPSIQLAASCVLFSAQSVSSLTTKGDTTYALVLMFPSSFASKFASFHSVAFSFIHKSAYSVLSSLNASSLLDSVIDNINTPLINLVTFSVSLFSLPPIPCSFEDSVLAYFTPSDSSFIDLFSILLSSFLSTGSLLLISNDLDVCNKWSGGLQSFVIRKSDKIMCAGHNNNTFIPGLIMQSCSFLPQNLSKMIDKPLTIVEFVDCFTFKIKQTPLSPWFKQREELNQSNLDNDVPVSLLTKSAMSSDVMDFSTQFFKLPAPLRLAYLESWLQSRWRLALSLVIEVSQSRSNLNSIQAPHSYLLNMAENLCVNFWSSFENLKASQALSMFM
ncbi:hypothetical protein RCL1_008926 [Eukaryota sp. TZLM3-RCL]